MNNVELVAMRTRSRHRLIGTIALVFIFVLLVPLLLDHQAPMFESSTKESRSESVTEHTEPKGQEAKSSTELSSPSPLTTPQASASAESGGDRSLETSNSSPISQQENATKVNVPDVIPPIPDPTGPGAKQSAKLEAPLDSASKVEIPKLESSKGWFVQLGVFAEETRALGLRDRLQERGVTLQTDTIQGPRGTFTRLRAGPFTDREAASVVLARIKSLGENAILVHQ